MLFVVGIYLDDNIRNTVCSRCSDKINRIPMHILCQYPNTFFDIFDNVNMTIERISIFHLVGLLKRYPVLCKYLCFDIKGSFGGFDWLGYDNRGVLTTMAFPYGGDVHYRLSNCGRYVAVVTLGRVSNQQLSNALCVVVYANNCNSYISSDYDIISEYYVYGRERGRNDLINFEEWLSRDGRKVGFLFNYIVPEETRRVMISRRIKKDFKENRYTSPVRVHIENDVNIDRFENKLIATIARDVFNNK